MVRSNNISTRTKLLFALALLLLIPTIWIARTRLTLCESKPHPNARHAPIPGASGNPADFGCKLFAPVTPTEKLIDLAAFVAILAFVRSLWMDIHLWRSKFPPSQRPKRQFGRDLFPPGPRE